MQVPEAERRVEELTALVEYQRCLIEQLERGGSDAVSARIIFDSLRVSLSLCIHERHRARCQIEPEQPATALTPQAPEIRISDKCESVQSKIVKAAQGPITSSRCDSSCRAARGSTGCPKMTI